DMPDALQPDVGGGRVLGLGVPPAAVAVFGPLHRVEPAASLEPGEPGGAPGLDTLEERAERLVQTPQGGLLGRKRPPALPVRVVGADVLQLPRLVAVPDGHPGFAVGDAAVFEGGVVGLPVVLQARGERGGLLGGRAQQELERPTHGHHLSAGRTASRYNAVPSRPTPRRPWPRSRTVTTAWATGN